MHAASVDDLKASPQYVVGTPDEVYERLRDVPGNGGIVFNPLAGGLPSALAWSSLELFAARVASIEQDRRVSVPVHAASSDAWLALSGGATVV